MPSKLKPHFSYFPGHWPLVEQFLRPQDKAILLESGKENKEELLQFIRQQLRQHYMINNIPLPNQVVNDRRIQVLDYDLLPMESNREKKYWS